MENRSYRIIYFSLGLIALLFQFVIMINWLFRRMPNFNLLNIIPYSLGLWLGILFIYRGVLAMRQDQQLFISFGSEYIHYRSWAGAKEKQLALHDLKAIEMHSLYAYLYDKSGKKHKLSWKEADYESTQLLKQKLAEINNSLPDSRTYYEFE